MKGSVKLFTIFGISIKIHVTFLLLPLIFGRFYGSRGVFLVCFVFLCVTFHELFHSLQARRYGGVVDSIILLPIGGLASMKSLPDKPEEEFRTAIAGPLFNFSLAAILFFPAYKLLGPDTFFSPSLETWPKTLAYAFWINPMLGAFNLLPAFPMDGGRVLRAFLARKMDFGRATRIAVGFGHTFALLFAFVGIMPPVGPNPILLLIALFIYLAASHEGAQVDIRMTLRQFYVEDVLPSQFHTVTTQMPLSKVLELIFHFHQEDFPVVEGEQLVGFLDRSDIISAIHQFGIDKQVGDIMRRQFPTAKPKDLLTSVHKIMESSGVKAIPVLEGTRLDGIVTIEDISRVYIMMSGKS